MRWSLDLFVVLCLLVFSHPTLADQKDPVLDRLFGELEGAKSSETARVIELSIWGVWAHSDNAAVNILMRTGSAAMEREDYAGALITFDQIVKIEPEFAEGWNKRATVLYLLGDYEGSLADIEQTLKLEPRHFGALAGRGLVLMEMSDEEAALKAFEDALAVNPFMRGARINAEALRKRLEESTI